MYKDFWKLERYPFENSPDPEFFYFSPRHREAVDWLTYAIRTRKGAAVLTGEVGCGKTVISRKLVHDLPAEGFDVAMVVNPTLVPVELLREILFQLGLAKIAKSKVEILHQLNGFLLQNHKGGRHTVILIDEAQAIQHPGTLEELRLLLNFQLNDAYLLTLLFIGQPEWGDRLSSLPQLEQRIAVRYNLQALESVETENYIRHRMHMAGGDGGVFSKEAIQLIHLVTEGIPRRINNLCDRSLLAAWQAGTPTVEASLVRRLAPR